MKYDKLVRDKIPEYVLAKGCKPVYHIAESEEYRTKLKAKLLEEANEFIADESIEEFADLMEVVEAIAAYKRFSSEAVVAMRDKKAAERGRFAKRIILEES